MKVKNNNKIIKNIIMQTGVIKNNNWWIEIKIQKDITILNRLSLKIKTAKLTSMISAFSRNQKIVKIHLEV